MLEKQFIKIQRKLAKIETMVKKVSEQHELDEFISEYDAKRLLKKGTTWFWNQRKKGLPYYKPAGEVMYKRKELAQWIESFRRVD